MKPLTRKRLQRPPLDSAVLSFICAAFLCVASFFVAFVLIGLCVLGADIAHVVREACMSVLKECSGVGPVSQRHLSKAVSDTVRSKAAHVCIRCIPDMPSPPFLFRCRRFPLVVTIFIASLRSARGAAAAAAAA